MGTTLDRDRFYCRDRDWKRVPGPGLKPRPGLIPGPDKDENRDF